MLVSVFGFEDGGGAPVLEHIVSADASPMGREVTLATPEHEAGGEQQRNAEPHAIDGLHDDCNQQVPT